MNFIPEKREENSPYLQLLMIACYATLGIIVGSVLSILVFMGMHGIGAIGKLADMANGNPAYVNSMKISQVLNTAFLFIFPAIWLARQEKIKLTSFYGFKKPDGSLLLLLFLIMVCSSPLMEWIALANQKMILPDFLKPLQDWMREKEDQAMKMTILLLKTRGIFDFIINLLVIAVLPAISEELLFRGAIQRTFTRMFANPHVAIWISAFIFSAIHMQFFGFFPRLLLGAGFGYIYWWTGSLWYAMFAHFLNNAYAVCVSWYMQAHHISLTEADSTANFKWYGYLISLLLTILLFIYFKHKNTQHNGKQLG